MSTHLHNDLALLHASLLAGKLPRSLTWADTLELIGQIGQVQPHGNDEFVFTVGTERAFFKKPHSHDLDVEEVARLRKFLREAGPAPASGTLPQPLRMVVVIDHHVAHVYQDFEEKTPEPGHTLHPYDPHGFHHHLIHKKEAHYKGERVPEEKSFYEDIAKLLRSANQIIVVGHGTGKSSAADHLEEYLKENHHDIARQVVARETIDLSALTAPQIEAVAKRHMIAVV